MSIGYGSKRLGIRRPPLSVSLGQIVGGGILLLLVAISLTVNRSFLKDAYTYASEALKNADNLRISEILSLTSLGLYAIIYLVAILMALGWGLWFFGDGLRDTILPWMPTNVPADYRNYGEVIEGFQKRVLSHYIPLRTNLGAMLGRNSMYMSPVAREVLKDLGKSLFWRVLRFIGGIIGLVLVIVYFSSVLPQLLEKTNLTSEFARVLTSKEIKTTLIVLAAIPIGMQVLFGIIELVAAFTMVPHGQPNTVATEGTEFYRGFGHPSQLISRLPDLAAPLSWNNFLNRCHPFYQETASPAVGDVGSFRSLVILEQQPQPLTTGNRFTGYGLLILGWLFFLAGIGVYLFFLTPHPLKEIVLNNQVGVIYIPVLLALIAGIASLLTASGGKFIRLGNILLESSIFRSPAILIEAVGNLSRADVRVGKSMVDSVESSNVSVRSDFTARFWAAELISESAKLETPRVLLALNQTPESEYWLQFFRTQIHTLRVEGVRPLGVDLGTSETQNIIQANVGVSALRANAVESAQLQAGEEQARPPQIEQKPTPLLNEFATEIQSEDVNQEPLLFDTTPPPQIQENDTGGFKECPQCAELVRAKAKKCRFCGYEFEPAP